MKLSEDEKQIILNLRKEKDASSPKLEGFLKEDLYRYPTDGDCELSFRPIEEDFDRTFWLATKSEKKGWMKKLDEVIQIVLKAGTRFICYIEDGKEVWFDDVNYGIESMDKEWARKYLINIRPIERKNKK